MRRDIEDGKKKKKGEGTWCAVRKRFYCWRKLQRKRKTEFQELVQKLVYFIEIIENNDYNKYL